MFREVSHMPSISGGDRYQVMFTALDDTVAPDSGDRVIDAFVGSLDLAAMGFSRAEPAGRRRPAFEPAGLLKLYVYGHRNDVRSSRKLERTCKVNVEAIWLTGSFTPDLHTIANFRQRPIEHRPRPRQDAFAARAETNGLACRLSRQLHGLDAHDRAPSLASHHSSRQESEGPKPSRRPFALSGSRARTLLQCCSSCNGGATCSPR